MKNKGACSVSLKSFVDFSLFGNTESSKLTGSNRMQEQTFVSWRSNFSFPSHHDKEENTAGRLFLFFCENFHTIVYKKYTIGIVFLQRETVNIRLLMQIFKIIISKKQKKKLT